SPVCQRLSPPLSAKGPPLFSPHQWVPENSPPPALGFQRLFPTPSPKYQRLSPP
ncbi:predicted protein, partial [Nematostella vectensis]